MEELHFFSLLVGESFAWRLDAWHLVLLDFKNEIPGLRACSLFHEC
jgi:hypothetical protein